VHRRSESGAKGRSIGRSRRSTKTFRTSWRAGNQTTSRGKEGAKVETNGRTSGPGAYGKRGPFARPRGWGKEITGYGENREHHIGSERKKKHKIGSGKRADDIRTTHAKKAVRQGKTDLQKPIGWRGRNRKEATTRRVTDIRDLQYDHQKVVNQRAVMAGCLKATCPW